MTKFRKYFALFGAIQVLGVLLVAVSPLLRLSSDLIVAAVVVQAAGSLFLGIVGAWLLAISFSARGAKDLARSGLSDDQLPPIHPSDTDAGV